MENGTLRPANRHVPNVVAFAVMVVVVVAHLPSATGANALSTHNMANECICVGIWQMYSKSAKITPAGCKLIKIVAAISTRRQPLNHTVKIA